MKKIYSLLAMVLVAGATFAQTITVAVNGKAVSEGETVECAFEEIKKEVIPGVLTNWLMEPHVVVTSSAAQDVTVGIEVLEKKGDNQIQNCFVNCITANSGNDFKVSETATMAAGQEKDAQIHFTTKTDPQECPLDRHVKVIVSTASESISFVLHMYWDPNGELAVGGIKMDGNSNSSAYSLSGVKLNSSSLPKSNIYIKNGKKFIKK